MAKPFLKWVGGKRQLMPELLKHVPASWRSNPERVYREPFIGGGAFFFELASNPETRPALAVLADANLRLVRTYRAIRDDVESVIALLDEHAACHSKEFFYATRANEPDNGTNAAVAAWLIYLNRTCFNGIYRVNRQGGFNVPFGDFKNPTICDAENLRACSEALKGVALEACSFSASIDDAQPGTFVYCDPPYVPLKATSNFTSYTVDGFDDKDQMLLAEKALEARERGVHILLSNSAAPRVYELYNAFVRREVSARRAVNSVAAGRGAIKELLIY